MKNKKTFISIIVLLVSVIFLGACEIVKPTPQPTPEPESTVTKQSFTDYFQSSVVAKYKQERSEYTDLNNQTYTINALIDRQLDLLTQDLIYRLTSVYGAGVVTTDLDIITTGNYGEKANILIDPLTSQPFMYNGKNAVVGAYQLISNASNTSNASGAVYVSGLIQINAGSSALSSPNITIPEFYAYALSKGTWDTNTVLGSAFNLTNAINGGFTYSNNKFNVGEYNSNQGWNLKNSTSLVSGPNSLDAEVVYNDYYINHFSTIKLALANVLASGNANGGLTYENAVNKIEKLGFNNTDKTNITNYILNNVIGTSVVNTDNAKKPSTNTITASTNLTDSQHTYKAYSLLVPKLVEQALNNTFVSTTKSIYENADRFDVISNQTIDVSAIKDRNFTELKITPKKSISLTKLEITVGGNVNLSNLTFSYTVYRTSGATPVFKTVTKGSSNTVLVIDFSSLGTVTMSTTGYILINISNNTNSTFNVEMTGYYYAA